MSFFYMKCVSGVLLLCSIFALTGCANKIPTLKANESIGNEEGILAIVSHSPFNNVVYEFRAVSGAGSWRNESEPFQAGVEFGLLRLPAGVYVLHRVVVGTHSIQFDKGKTKFEVKRGQINYFGDMFLSQSQPGWLGVQWVDKQEVLEIYLAAKHPTVLSSYPVTFATMH